MSRRSTRARRSAQKWKARYACRAALLKKDEDSMVSGFILHFPKIGRWLSSSFVQSQSRAAFGGSP